MVLEEKVWITEQGALAEAPGRWRFEGNAATRKHTMVKQKYFKGANELLGKGQKYTKYNKRNNNSENFKGARLLPGALSPSDSYLVAGLSEGKAPAAEGNK